jgi:glycosyltransferase involved in cell wall biosynthesis
MDQVVQEVAEEFPIKVGKVDIDAEPALAARFDLQKIPTVLIFREGKLVKRIEEAKPKEYLVQILKSIQKQRKIVPLSTVSDRLTSNNRQKRKMGKLIACLSVFNEIKNLPACLEGLEAADIICIVDGAYKDFPHDKPWSTDGTLEYLRDLAKSDQRVHLITCEKPWPGETVKRSQYFIGEEGDWYFLIDADERVEGLEKLKIYLPRCPYDSLGIPFYMYGDGRWRWMGRVVRHLSGITYGDLCIEVVVNGRQIAGGGAYQGTFGGLKIRHYPYKREIERRKAKVAYYERLFAREIQILAKRCQENPADKDLRRSYEEYKHWKTLIQKETLRLMFEE